MEALNAKPAISVIVPAYNREKYIGQAISSVLQQTFRNIELIVVNDGSTDNTSEVARRFAQDDYRVRLIDQENSGVSVARNSGIREAKGSYICFLDSDDYYDQEFLSKMYDRIVRENADICYTGYKIVSSQRCRRVLTKFSDHNVLRDYVLDNIKVPTSGWLIKKEVLTKNNIIFSTNLSWGEDFEFFCKILAASSRVCYVRDYLTNVRMYEDPNRLSAFSMDKIDQDYAYIQKLVNNPVVGRDSAVVADLVRYRLSALITYRLLLAIRRNVEKKLIVDYFTKYREYIQNLEWTNGLRSLKLNVSKLMLMLYVYKLSHSRRNKYGG